VNDSTPAVSWRHAVRPLLPVLLGVFVLCVALLLWALAGPISGLRPVGDGNDPTTYGFDLSNDRFDGGILVASGHARDFLVALDSPETTPGIQMGDVNRQQRGKEIVTTDRVVGVTVGGESRAYPVSLLNAHEVVNDELGGVPIAIVFSPLADAPVVFDRRLGDRVAQFRVSGLLLDSTLLIYDDREPTEEPSLFCPLRGMAVTGEAAAADTRLVMLPGVQLVAWREWLSLHPTTTVARRDPATARRYREFSYRRYLDGAGPIFPIGRAVPADGPPPMAAMILIEHGEHRRLWRVDQLLRNPARRTTVSLGDATIDLVADSATSTVRVDAPRDVILRHGLWFALHAADPSVAELLERDDRESRSLRTRQPATSEASDDHASHDERARSDDFRTDELGRRR